MYVYRCWSRTCNLRHKNDSDGKNYTESCVCVEVNKKNEVVWESYACSDRERNSYQNYRMERVQLNDDLAEELALSTKIQIKIPSSMSNALKL